MQWFNGSRIRVAMFTMVVGALAGGGSARADFTFDRPTNLGASDKEVGPFINLNCSNEYSPCVSADGLELYFTSTRTGKTGCVFGDWNLWVSRRATKDDAWGPPESLGERVNSPESDGAPCLSPDGLELYFQSDRPGSVGEGDIWVVRRAAKDAPWGEPENLGPPVNSLTWDFNPCLSSDGLEMYMAFDAGGSQFQPKLAVTRRPAKDAPWEAPMVLGPVVNSWPCQDTPWISTDGLVLFFSDYWGCPRPGGYGDRDLWFSRRATKESEWGPPVNLGPQVNTAWGELFPMISADGRTLYFSSNRCGGSGWGNYDLWQARIVPVVDFDEDGEVGMTDLLTMIGAWGTDNPLCDIGPTPWGDGVVDAADLEVLMEHWQQATSDPPELLAHWTLDEAEGMVAYDSVGTNDANLIGDPVWQPLDGIVDGAIELDGVGDGIETGFVVDAQNSPFSVFAWVKGGASGQIIISQASGANWLLADPFEGNLITDLVGPPGIGGSGLRSATPITDGQWHRVGLTWDGFGGRTLYVDDVEVAHDTMTKACLKWSNTQGGLHIGAPNRLHFPGYWSGLIDDVQIYKGVVKP